MHQNTAKYCKRMQNNVQDNVKECKVLQKNAKYCKRMEKNAKVMQSTTSTAKECKSIASMAKECKRMLKNAKECKVLKALFAILDPPLGPTVSNPIRRIPPKTKI